MDVHEEVRVRPYRRRTLAHGGLLAGWPLVELLGRKRPNARTYPDTGR
jgi:hypothetical protein